MVEGAFSAVLVLFIILFLINHRDKIKLLIKPRAELGQVAPITRGNITEDSFELDNLENKVIEASPKTDEREAGMIAGKNVRATKIFVKPYVGVGKMEGSNIIVDSPGYATSEAQEHNETTTAHQEEASRVSTEENQHLNEAGSGGMNFYQSTVPPRSFGTSSSEEEERGAGEQQQPLHFSVSQDVVFMIVGLLTMSLLALLQLLSLDQTTWVWRVLVGIPYRIICGFPWIFLLKNAGLKDKFLRRLRWMSGEGQEIN